MLSARAPPRRPRPPAARGRAFPMRRTPRLIGVFPGPRAPPPAPYHPGAHHRPPVHRRRCAIRPLAEVTVPRWHLRRHGNVTGEAVPPCAFSPLCRHRRSTAPSAPPRAVPPPPLLPMAEPPSHRFP
jgi:hypothetical protein